jgi:hypothetical protein
MPVKNPFPMSLSRREFLLKTGAAANLALAANPLRAAASMLSPRVDVVIVSDPQDAMATTAPAKWAVDQLRDALTTHGFGVRFATNLREVKANEHCVVAAGRHSALAREIGTLPPDAPESLALVPGKLGSRDVLLAAGSDARGLAYALTELADAIALAGDDAAARSALQPAQAITERPANAIRSVMWVYTSIVEDPSWFYSRDYWNHYLTMLATQRFNRLNLSFGLGYDGPTELLDTYFYFTYPFLVSVPGYDVRVTNLSDAERTKNLEMLRFISDAAAERGIQFYLGLWNHAYEWTKSPNANYVINGLTPQTHGAYCRDALALILKECPNIVGVNFRIHGESGVPEGNPDFWKTVFDGLVRSGRRMEFDLHAKGMNEPVLKAALDTGFPVDISPKFSGEHQGLPYHQAAVRPDERVSPARGLLLRYGFGDLFREDRPYGIFHRIWPGTQRMLLWGDPKFAAAYSRAGGFCGSRGMEIFAHLAFKGRKGGGLPGGRDGYADLTLRAPGDDFEKFRYTYRVWGRMLYNPNTRPEVWQRYLRAVHGGAAGTVESSLASASRVLPLITTAHIPSPANNNYSPEVPVNQPLFEETNAKPFLDTRKPRVFGNVSPLDPQLFYRINEYVDDLLKGSVNGKYTPLEVAAWLEKLVGDTRGPISSLPSPPRSRAYRRFKTDAEILAGLGAYMSLKLRCGILFELHERTGFTPALDQSLTLYREARDVWNQIDRDHAYVRDITYGYEWFQRGSWSTRLQMIDDDIARLEKKTTTPTPPPTTNSPVPADQLEPLVRQIASLDHGILARPEPQVSHTPPATFRRGEPVALALTKVAGAAAPHAAKLFYRHVNQAEDWQSADMTATSAGCEATVPAAYAESPYPLSYYFEVTGAPAAPSAPRATLYPGFSPTLDNQPYFVLRAAS